jgi:glycosyltransferase involved in cell wall biosynthesis
MTGLLRPYKGTQELLRAWQRIVSSTPDCPVHLVIAGHIQDPAVHPLISALASQAPGSLTVIPRRLTDGELAGVLRRSELVVAPYRAVLTSGTYYLATTFATPVVAPAKGMFTEVIAHGESGWLYDGSEAGLEQQLRALLRNPPEAFRMAGDAAHRRNVGADAAALSARFFSWLLSYRD